MIRVCVLPLQEDLSEFTHFLWEHEIPHRIVETETTQELWVIRTVNPDQILALYERWKGGEDLSQLQVVFHGSEEKSGGRLSQSLLTSGLLGVSILLSLLTAFGENFELVSFFTIADIVPRGNGYFTSGLYGTFESLQLWRFITPIFLHFSVLHIIFNLLWVWVVGRRMEFQQGRVALAGLVVVAGVCSNIAQYWVSGPLFGGMSGVVFALLGYAWLWDKTHSVKLFNLPPALMGFMVVWLVLGYTGLLESLGFGSIANTAHLVGLVAGLCLVPVINFFHRRRG